MAPTLRRITAIPPLRLRVLAGGDALDRPVRWVAVSELEDPTPFLEGGELVLTTGMRLRPGDAGSYVARLVARGVAGLGLGVGLGHDVVPPELVEAAADAGLPLVEVPHETPFVAIGKAVSELLAAERYEEVTRAFAAQGRLTRAALRPDGASAVVRRLAAEIGGWAVLFDAAGTVLATGGSGPEQVEALLPELDRLRGGPGRGGTSSMAVSGPDRHVIVQPLGVAGRPRGFFAAGADHPLSPVAQTVVNAACSLLTLALEQEAGPSAARRRIRTAVLRLLLAGEAGAAKEVLAALGERPPAGELAVLVTAAGPDAVGEAVAGRRAFVAELRDRTVLLVAAADAPEVMGALSRIAAVGCGDPVPAPGADTAADTAAGAEPGVRRESGTALGRALEQAERALAAARRAGVPAMRFADLPGQGLLSLLDPEAAAAFARALLAPLLRYGSRADLLESLHAYLAANGHWDAAAQRLGIHRHTLRYRMRKVADLLDRDLDDPATRAELWVACSLLCGQSS
ncbi:PucR family transcriptional regulator [Thermostaphylospora chromogena]|uniref:Purine catabolism regulatory protein n=1 Tax=Thermostaphylospora chromogena TaxID=35622 RepID=A0A1H1FDS7_9ACTN|nr:PucR family transcriptional regulator [Thermostaphylospora chromogena]SDQ99091.1 purine catabolism regulatory protein [Thermostaphylospora chromogena]